MPDSAHEPWLKLTRALSEGASQEKAVSVLLETLAGQFPESTWALLSSPKPGTFLWSAASGPRADRLELQQPFTDDALGQWAAASESSGWVSESEMGKGLLEFSSVAWVPLRFRGQLLAFAVGLHQSPLAFSAEQLEQAGHFGPVGAALVALTPPPRKLEPRPLSSAEWLPANALAAELKQELARAVRFIRRLSVCAIEISAEEGVTAPSVEACAQAIRRSLRQVDMSFLMEGHRFVALLVETDASGALTTAERIRARLRRELGVKAVMGLATHPEHASDPQKLLTLAHEALEEARASAAGIQTARVLDPEVRALSQNPDRHSPSWD